MAGPQIGIIMGSTSDWETMRHAAETLDALGVLHETRVVSAHRTPQRLYDYAHSAKERGLKAIIAGAGGAAHLPGMAASMTGIPVLGVPIESKALKGIDSLLSIVQMPAGIPVGTLAIGKAGAINAALLAAAMLANSDEALGQRGIAGRQDRRREQPGVGRARLADRQRADRDAGRHLHDRVQRILPLERLGLDRHAEHRQMRQRGDHARQVRRAAGPGDDDLEAPVARALGILDQPSGGAVGGNDA